MVSLGHRCEVQNNGVRFVVRDTLAIRSSVLRGRLDSGTSSGVGGVITAVRQRRGQVVHGRSVHALVVRKITNSKGASVTLRHVTCLLCAFESDVSSGSVLVVSPGGIFSSCVSGILPRLKRRAIPRADVRRVLSKILRRGCGCRACFKLIGRLLRGPSSDLVSEVTCGTSFNFVSRLSGFVLRVRGACFGTTSIGLAGCVAVPTPFVRRRCLHFGHCPVHQQFSTVTSCVLSVLGVRCAFAMAAANEGLLGGRVELVFTNGGSVRICGSFFG